MAGRVGRVDSLALSKLVLVRGNRMFPDGSCGGAARCGTTEGGPRLELTVSECWRGSGEIIGNIELDGGTEMDWL